jgi:hypothetical protein
MKDFAAERQAATRKFTIIYRYLFCAISAKISENIEALSDTVREARRRSLVSANDPADGNPETSNDKKDKKASKESFDVSIRSCGGGNLEIDSANTA